MRVRALHRQMPFEVFERTVPVLPGWKREYYDDTAHVRPSWTTVVLDLTTPPRPSRRIPGLRQLAPADRPVLTDAFLDAFRLAPDHCDYPMAAYRSAADKYFDGYFGEVRGVWSAASVGVIREGRLVAAALLNERPDKAPLLDCLMVRPAHSRRGLASAVVTAALHRVRPAGPVRLVSTVRLANAASLAWHAAYGFTERVDMMVLQARCFSLKYELERRAKYDPLPPDEADRLHAQCERLWSEIQRLHALPVDVRIPLFDP